MQDPPPFTKLYVLYCLHVMQNMCTSLQGQESGRICNAMRDVESTLWACGKGYMRRGGRVGGEGVLTVLQCNTHRAILLSTVILFLA